ncbi:MAG: hypothetical protein AAB152_12285 [Candidatus Coatesbacteria bacterium]
MAKPIRKYGEGAVSLAVFVNEKEDGSKNEFYSLQRSRKIGDEWKNESVLLSKEQLAIVHQIVGEALSGEEGASSSSRSSSCSCSKTPGSPVAQDGAAKPISKKREPVQTRLTETEAERDAQLAIIENEWQREELAKEEVQVIEVYDWGMVERKNYKGEVERLHDFLVHSDNAIVAVGMGNIDEAIAEVRSELEEKGYRKISVKRMPMKEGERIPDSDAFGTSPI